LAEMGARESIPIRILLHPSSSHDLPGERRVEARHQGAIGRGGERCELKVPMEIKRTARIHCEGHVLTGAIASRYPVKEEKVSTPIQRSERI
jgi:hypothetical protein